MSRILANFLAQFVQIRVIRVYKIEFQSTVDRFMAVRMLNYLTNFYLDYARAHRLVRRLPPIFPLVLYSGDRRWTAATEISDLIDGTELLGPYRPSFRYYKRAENEFAADHLLEISNIVSTLFLAEQEVAIDTKVAALVELFDREDDKQAVSILVNWFRQMIMHGRIDPDDQAVMTTTLQSKEEVTHMLKTFTREKRAEFERGRQEGLDQGIEQGVELGVLRVARNMLAAGISPSASVEYTDLSLDAVLTLHADAQSDHGKN